MLWSTGSVYFLGNHCKYFIQFHIVLCSTEHWWFDVNSVNVLTSVAATFFPPAAPCAFQRLGVGRAHSVRWDRSPGGSGGTPSWEEARSRVALTIAAAHPSPQSLSFPPPSRMRAFSAGSRAGAFPVQDVLVTLGFTALLYSPGEEQQRPPQSICCNIYR